MHVYDAGGDDGIYARFECPKCEHRTDWMECGTVTEAKRGVPCPTCNTPETLNAHQ